MSLHSPTCHPQAVSTLLSRLLSVRITPEQLEYIHSWNTSTSDLIWMCLQIHRGLDPVKLQNIQAGRHILRHRCHPIPPQGTLWVPPWWHRAAGRDPSHPQHSTKGAPQGFPLALCPRQALISLHLASIAHGQAQPGRKQHILNKLAQESPQAAEPSKRQERTLALVLSDKPKASDPQELQTAQLRLLPKEETQFQGLEYKNLWDRKMRVIYPFLGK